MSYTDIIKNWKTATETDCIAVKEYVSTLITDWKDKLLAVMQTNQDNIYVIYSNTLHNVKCITYDTIDNIFTVVNKNYRMYVPDCLEIYAICSLKTIFGSIVNLYFVKYTGIFMLVAEKFDHEEESGGTSRLYFKDENTLSTCINYCQDNSNTFTMESLSCSSPEARHNSPKDHFPCKNLSHNLNYEFDYSYDLNRAEKWYSGHWKNMEPYENDFEMSSLETFINDINDLINQHDFTCNICREYGTYTDQLHCIDCISSTSSWCNPISFDICKKCYLDNKHNVHVLAKNHHIHESNHKPMFDKYVEKIGYHSNNKL